MFLFVLYYIIKELLTIYEKSLKASFILFIHTCICIYQFSQFSSSVVSDSLRHHEPQHARPPSPSPTPRVHPKPVSIESVMPSIHLILCHPLLFLPSTFPSTRVFSNESALHIRWPKYWSFSFSISPFNEHPGLISFRMDWLDLLAVQGTLKSLLHTSSLNICMYMYIYLSKVSKKYPKLSKNRL